jgi:adenosylmethionine-8-amino-7-oxononanoate aminotransferase
MTGGYLSMAATLCTPSVAARVCGGEAGALMHGPTFMGNPLAAAVACANLDLLTGSDWAGAVTRIAAGLRAGLAGAAAVPGVADVRVLGAIGVIETGPPVDVPRVTEAALAHGVWLRPFRNLIYTMPPYITTDDDVARISAAMVEAARANSGES